MVSWSLTLWLMLLSAALPLVFFACRQKSLREHVRSDARRLQYLRRNCKDLEDQVMHNKTLFFEALEVPFLLLQPTGKLVMVNRAAENLLEMKLRNAPYMTEILPSGELRDHIEKALETANRCEQTLSLKQNGHPCSFRVIATPMGKVERLIGIVFHDITEMQRAQTIRREFVANASHELRTPLTIIRGYLENLLEDDELAADAAQRTRALKLISKHTDRIVRLVEDMLTISRLETGDTGYLHREDFDLSECVTEVIQNLEPTIRAQSATIQHQMAPIRLFGDRFYWAQIFYNLIENALKNNPQPGLHISVTAQQKENGELHISVEDNGIGITPEALPFIFNRFFRADKSGLVRGTGLGLAIVRHAVEAHGGSIHAESTPHVRTVFTIRLPHPQEEGNHDEPA